MKNRKTILIQPHTTRQNLTTSLKRKFSQGDIQKYTDICFNVLQESSSWESENRAVQMFFLTPNRKWKICKLRRFFGCVLGAYYFHCEKS